MRHAEQAVEDVTEWRNAVQVVQDEDGGHRPEDDVTGDVRALVGEVVEILAKFAAGLTVDLVRWYQLCGGTPFNIVRPESINNSQ